MEQDQGCNLGFLVRTWPWRRRWRWLPGGQCPQSTGKEVQPLFFLLISHFYSNTFDKFENLQNPIRKYFELIQIDPSRPNPLIQTTHEKQDLFSPAWSGKQLLLQLRWGEVDQVGVEAGRGNLEIEDWEGGKSGWIHNLLRWTHKHLGLETREQSVFSVVGESVCLVS